MTGSIALIAHGGRQIGLGHVFRVLNLKRKLLASSPCASVQVFVLLEDSDFLDWIKSVDQNLIVIDSLAAIPGEFSTLVLDMLSVSVEDYQCLRSRGQQIVSFDETGPGAALADITVNSLYLPTQKANRGVSHFEGLEYSLLADEVWSYSWKNVFDPKLRVIVAQGGTDTHRAVPRLARMLSQLFPELEVSAMSKEAISGCTTYAKVPNLFQFLTDFDFAVFGGGIMALEAYAIGLPVIHYSEEEKESQTIRHLVDRVGSSWIQCPLEQNIEQLEVAVSRFLSFSTRQESSDRQKSEMKSNRFNEVVETILNESGVHI